LRSALGAAVEAVGGGRVGVVQLAELIEIGFDEIDSVVAVEAIVVGFDDESDEDDEILTKLGFPQARWKPSLVIVDSSIISIGFSSRLVKPFGKLVWLEGSDSEKLFSQAVRDSKSS